MKNSIIITSVISLGIGYFVGSLKPAQIKLEEVEVFKETIKETIKEKKVEVVKEVPIVDKSGDEALAQAFTLFLAALGLEKIKVEKDEVKEIMKDPSDFIARNSIKEKLAPKQDTDKDNESRWGMPHNTAGTSTSEYERVRFSPIPAITEPTVFLAKSKVINDAKELQKINGSYAGQINFFDGKYKGQRHRIVLNVDYFASDDGKGTDGQSEILLYDEDGKNYSHSRGTGGNRNILNGEDGSFVVRIVDNTFIHFVTKFGMKTGNYYEDGKLVGAAKLFEN